jgi:hypothetical protein
MRERLPRTPPTRALEASHGIRPLRKTPCALSTNPEEFSALLPSQANEMR